MIVADANLIVYRFLKGPFTALSDAAVGKDSDWRTAPLWRYEFTSAVATMIIAKVVDEPTAVAAIGAAGAEMISRELLVPQELALEAAIRYRISAYDAQYIALAEELAVPCVTADVQLAAKVPNVAVLLADFVK